jgi:hypothetical protein
MGQLITEWRNIKMSQAMTIKEIESCFPDEWVLVIDPDTGPDLGVRSGVVAAHSKNRDDVDRVALVLRPRDSAIWFNGEPPEGSVIVL